MGSKTIALAEGVFCWCYRDMPVFMMDNSRSDSESTAYRSTESWYTGNSGKPEPLSP